MIKNITSPPKTISVFNTNIKYNNTKNLIDIPGVGEEDIRISLLKGQILNKILSGDIEIVLSDINVLNFNNSQQTFLTNSDITYGNQVTAELLPYAQRRDVSMVGPIDGYNTHFYCPTGDYFLMNYSIIIHWNGVRQRMNADFFIDVSSQDPTYSTAYSAIYMAIPLSPGDVLVADYYVLND